MAKSLATADSLIRDLKDTLEFRLAGSATIDTVRQARDADGWPLLILSDDGDEDAGDPVIVIRIRAVDAVSKDVFGNDNVAFTPHTLELAYQVASGAAIPARADLAKAQHEASRLSVRTLIKEATGAVEAGLDAAAVIADLDWIQYPTKLR